MQSKKVSPKIAVIILAIMSFIFGGVGAAFLFFSAAFVDNAYEVSGTVIDVSASYSDGSTTYKPTISYVDRNGVKQTGQTFLSSSGYNFPRGSKVNILYDPRNPSSLRMNSWFALWGFPMIFLGVGILLGVIALVVALSTKKRKPTVAPQAARSKATYGYSSNSPEEERTPTVRRR